MKLKQSLRQILNPALAAALVAPGIVFASPAGEEVVRGSATVERPDANSTVINQTSDRAVVNWQSFSVGGQEYVLFNQPSSSSVILNRVLGNDASTILGTIQANGRVFLVNPNGVFFGESATLDVNGLVASTLDINDDDFMDGNYVLRRVAGSAAGTVQNAGSITTAEGGFVVLAGDYVENTGVVAARLGHVVMASGAEVTLDMDGTGLIGFAVDQATLAELAGVRNTGEILAAGGMVIMTAKVARDLMSTVVNNEGLIAAHSVEDRSGVIYLHGVGGDVEHSGALIADGLGEGESGGDIRLIASGTLTVDANASISAQGSERGGFVEVSGHQDLNLGGDITIGNGGTLLIDPNTLTIVPGGGAPSTFTNSTVGVGFIEAQLNSSTNVRLLATQLIGADPFVTSITALAGNGELLIHIGVPSGASAGNCGDFGFCAGPDSALGVITGGTGGNILLGHVDINILGNFNAVGDPDWTLSGDIALGHVNAADIYIDANGSVTTGNLTAASGHVRVYAGSVDQQVNLNTGDITSFAGDVDVYLWSENPSPGTDSLNVGAVSAADELYISSDHTYERNMNFMVTSVSAMDVYVNPELYGGGTLTANIGNVTANYAEIDGRVYGPTGGGTLTISGIVNVADQLYIWTYGDQPVNLSIANHLGGSNYIDLESSGNLNALNVTALYEVDIGATGDVTVGNIFAEYGIWLYSDAGSVTAANVSLVYHYGAVEGSIYITSDTGMNIGGVFADSDPGVGIEISNNTSGDIVIMGGVHAQSAFGNGYVSIFQWGVGDISVGGIIKANDLQIFNSEPGNATELAGIDLATNATGNGPYLNFSLSGDLTLGSFSFVDTSVAMPPPLGAGGLLSGEEGPLTGVADVYIYADGLLTIFGNVYVEGAGDVFLTLDSVDLDLGPGANVNLVSTGGGITGVTLYGESINIDGTVEANHIIVEFWDPSWLGTVGQHYSLTGTGTLIGRNPGGDATVYFGLWPDSDIQMPTISLELGSIVLEGDYVVLDTDFGDGTITLASLSNSLTIAQTGPDPLDLFEMELQAQTINIAAQQSVDLSFSMVEVGGLMQVVSNAGNIHVSGATIEANRLVMQAAGGIVNATPATLIANAMLLETPGNIDLGASTLIIGDGTIAGAVGDTAAIGVLADFDLASNSTIPNGTIRAGGTISISSLEFGGDYLVLQASGFSLGTFTGPNFQYIVQVAPISPNSNLLLTGPTAGAVTVNAVIASWDNFLSKFAGATYILGASDFGGVINTGRSATLDMGSHNVLFASTVNPPLLGEVVTSGIILTMNGRVGTVDKPRFRTPTTAEIMGTDFRRSTDTRVRTVTRFGQPTTTSDDPERDDTIRHGSDDNMVCEG